MALNFSQGYTSGGSINSAQSSSWSNTAGREASATGAQQAALANSTAMANWQKAAEYNAEQARIQREWQERMANTVYQRSVTDMKKAGINPILAANMGLGTASVGSGATASMSDANAFMGQTFAEQNSASTSSSSGSSWQHSENGLSTFAKDLASLASGILERVNSSQTINFSLEGLKDFATSDTGKTILTGNTPVVQYGEKIGNKVKEAVKSIVDWFKR